MEGPGPLDLRHVNSALSRIGGGGTGADIVHDREAAEVPGYLMRRGVIATGALLAFLGLVFYRVLVLQLFLWPHYAELEARLRPRALRPPDPPGEILDAYGRTLATSRTTWAVKVDPDNFRRAYKERTTRDEAVRVLADVLQVPEKTIREAINKPGHFAYLKRPIDRKERDRVRAAIEKNDIKHVDFDREYERVYLLDKTACHAIGWRGPDQSPRMGLEAVYDFVLQSQPGSSLGATDAHGREIPSNGRGKPYRGRPGRYLVTTIDIDIQTSLETALDKVVRQYRPKRAMGIVMDPRTGEVLAMAARPCFNPNDFCRRGEGRKKVTKQDLINPVTQTGFEPGSCMKPFVVAAALEEGVTNETERFYCNGVLTEAGGPPIHCAHGARHGSLTLVDVVARSCNVSAARLALRLGGERLIEWLKMFGFARPTGIELPEGLGLLPPGPGRQRLYPRDVACLGFGQGLSVTLIQLASAYCALANDGVLMLPHLVKRVEERDGTVFRRVEPLAVRRVCSAATSRRVLSMLESVVERGTGKAARIEGVRVGGKTGTADRPKRGGGFEGYVSSFVMVVPVDDPQYVIVIVVDYPHGGHYGGVVAAPAAREVALTALRVHRGIAALQPSVGEKGDGSQVKEQGEETSAGR